MPARTMQTVRRPRLYYPRDQFARRHVNLSVKANAGNGGKKELVLMKSELSRMRGADVDEDVDTRVTRSGRSMYFTRSR